MRYRDDQEKKYERKKKGPTPFANHLASKIKKKDMDRCVAGKMGLDSGGVTRSFGTP